MKKQNPNEIKFSRLSAVSPAPFKERAEAGRALRADIPRASHAAWVPPADRDPIALLENSNQGRVESLIPYRYSRMQESIFTFYRGAPAVMAYDLAHTPSSGIPVQLCGDCHVNNFGLYASPERSLVFDLNDFDETLPGPFEWDVKRLAASVVIAARNAGLNKREARESALATARIYREKMRDYSSQSYLDTWYRTVEAEDVMQMVDKKHRKTASTQLSKVRSKDRLAAFNKLTEETGGERRIIHNPPLIIRLDREEEDVRQGIRELFTAYYESLEDSLKLLLSRYRFIDMAHKVVGVGSVGTRCLISLWIGVDEGDPLFLQVKQARASILEPYLGRSEYDHPGKRIVTGQRMMQATNDIFLGYGKIGNEAYFIRQLYDMKGGANLDQISAKYLERYAGLCAAVLARAHARTGDAAKISGYMGKSDEFDSAISEFAFQYADQNEADYQVFQKAIHDGRLQSSTGR